MEVRPFDGPIAEVDDAPEKVKGAWEFTDSKILQAKRDEIIRALSPIYAGLKYIVVAYIILLAFWLQLAGAGHRVSMPPWRV